MLISNMDLFIHSLHKKSDQIENQVFNYLKWKKYGHIELTGNISFITLKVEYIILIVSF